MAKYLSFRHCFICGWDNPEGLHIPVEEDEGTARAEWVADANHCGYNDIVHGGILVALMDDVMAHALCSLDLDTVTAHLEVDYRSPAHIGDKLVITGELVERGTGRALRTKGRITCEDRVIAECTSVMVIVKKEQVTTT